ncbi:hypothetical protein T10_3049 [Trichinella papuae]|uniref:Uncharacterized protein n=1 Tax=Trichinella papuae TaxID=268474 RepID=A0A0V1MHT3_9BILA|nr:hypothetical protein T10_3049 [Trichinella papuae]
MVICFEKLGDTSPPMRHNHVTYACCSHHGNSAIYQTAAAGTEYKEWVRFVFPMKDMPHRNLIVKW